METEFIRKRTETENIISFFFTKPQAFVFDAGDFTELSLDYPSGGDKRWFTIASAPSEDILQITMKYPPSPSEFKQQLAKLKRGDKATLSPALGKFNLPRDKTEQLLFVAGGVGITPFRSMLKQLIDQGEKRDILLVYVAKTGEYAFKNLIAESSAKIQFEASDFNLNSINTDDRTIFLSGPEPMMKNYFKTLIASGIHRTKIMLDYFPGYTEL